MAADALFRVRSLLGPGLRSIRWLRRLISSVAVIAKVSNFQIGNQHIELSRELRDRRCLALAVSPTCEATSQR